MSDYAQPRTSKRPGKRSEPKTLFRFIEELSWLLSSYEDLDFRALGALSENLALSQRTVQNLRNHTLGRPQTTQMLVGILPSLLIDEKLFPQNEDIIEFSGLALGITIPRWHKKSKFELIGHIVCSAEKADLRKLQQLVRILEDITDEKGETRKVMEAQRKSGLSWNEVIQRLLEAAK